MKSKKTSVAPTRSTLVIPPGQGRAYPMGRMSAVFKADGNETQMGYSISEWWLEPNTRGPGTHAHPEDHVFYVIEGLVSVFVENRWSDACKGTYILIPGGMPHDFENRSSDRAGFMSLKVPGGFETKIPATVEWFAENPPGDVSTL